MLRFCPVSYFMESGERLSRYILTFFRRDFNCCGKADPGGKAVRKKLSGKYYICAYMRKMVKYKRLVSYQVGRSDAEGT